QREPGPPRISSRVDRSRRGYNLSMKTKRLGREGPELSVVGFGAWEAGGDDYGPNESAEDVIATIRAALDAGMNWIDTAEVYGDGTSKRIVDTLLHMDEDGPEAARLLELFGDDSFVPADNGSYGEIEEVAVIISYAGQMEFGQPGGGVVIIRTKRRGEAVQ
ncbi:MAG: aldo/keto reductase, partial [Gemmatimonadetes bacterium]|nr:aldo/keto reductase [Gemmatimonadota bacterium]